LTTEQLCSIVNLDNHHKHPNSNTCISSEMIVKEFGGIETIAQKLFTNLKTGIKGDKQDLEERQRVFGRNSFPPPKIKTIMELVAENFDDTINQILFGAAVVSIIIGWFKEGLPDGLIEGTSILISLTIIIVVNSGNNWVSERRLAALVNLSEQQDVAVQRNSNDTITIDSRELVVGDVVHFEAGMKVPADLIMIEGQDVSCNEGELTGEPDYVEKYRIDESNWDQGVMGTMLAKSLVATGFGKAIVVAVGPKTVAGVITEKTQTEN